ASRAPANRASASRRARRERGRVYPAGVSGEGPAWRPQIALYKSRSHHRPGPPCPAPAPSPLAAPPMAPSPPSPLAAATPPAADPAVDPVAQLGFPAAQPSASLPLLLDAPDTWKPPAINSLADLVREIHAVLGSDKGISSDDLLTLSRVQKLM